MNTQLRRLIVDLPGTIVPLLSRIVARSPSLRQVSIRDQTFSWACQRSDPLIAELARLESLHTLEIPSPAFSYLLDGFTSVKHLTVTWDSETLYEPNLKVS